MNYEEKAADCTSVGELFGEAEARLPPTQARELERLLCNSINTALIMQYAREADSASVTRAG